MLKNIKHFLMTVTTFSLLGYSYIHYTTTNNKKQYDQFIQSQSNKDASRLTNESFGISWGFQADNIIMKQLDSGDLLFLKYDCNECLSVNDWINCHKNSLTLLEQEYHSIGIGYRIQQDSAYIVYNEFGKNVVRRYSDLVGLPYLKELSIQKCKNSRQAHKKLREILGNVEDDKVQINGKKQSSLQLAKTIAKILKIDPKSINNLRDLLKTNQLINVRTQTSRTLRSL